MRSPTVAIDGLAGCKVPAGLAGAMGVGPGEGELIQIVPGG